MQILGRCWFSPYFPTLKGEKGGLWDQFLNQLTDFDEVWNRRSTTADYPKTSSFQYLAITNNNMATARICDAEATISTLPKVTLKAHLNLSITWRRVVSFTPRLPYSWGKTTGTHSIWAWFGPRTVWIPWKWEKSFLFLPGFEPRIVSCPNRSTVTILTELSQIQISCGHGNTALNNKQMSAKRVHPRNVKITTWRQCEIYL